MDPGSGGGFGKYSRFQVMGMIKEVFFGLKFLIPRFVGVENLAGIFFLAEEGGGGAGWGRWLDLRRDFRVFKRI